MPPEPQEYVIVGRYETRRYALGLRWALLLGLFYLALARLCQVRVRGHGRIFLAEIFQDVLGDAGAEGAIGRLHLAIDFGHFRGELLTERRAIELEQALDVILREVLVVDGDQLAGCIIRVEFRFVVLNECINKLLTAVGGGNRGEKIVAELIGPMSGEILHSITRADEFHQ
jgi:hypothetical protein